MQWDEDLAEMAQAWADQCALVEYNSGGQRPKRLFHDARAKRSVQGCRAVPSKIATVIFFKNILSIRSPYSSLYDILVLCARGRSRLVLRASSFLMPCLWSNRLGLGF